MGKPLTSNVHDEFISIKTGMQDDRIKNDASFKYHKSVV